MTTTDLYRRLTYQPKAIVFGWTLLPYTVGHAILFDRLDVQSIQTPAEVCLAARLCSMHADDAERWLSGRWASWRIAWMTRTRRAWMMDAEEVAKGKAVLEQYLDEGTRIPSFTAKSTEDGKTSGVPFAQRLRVVLLSRLNYTPDEVNRTPYIRALWDYIAWADVEGHVHVPVGMDDEEEKALIANGEALAKMVQEGKIKC